MSDDKRKSPRRNAAKFRKALEEVEAGKDIVAVVAAGAKGLVDYKDAIANNDLAVLFAPPKPKRGRPSKYDPSWMNDAMIEAARLGASKEKIVSILGISLETFRTWKNQHPEFLEAVKEAELLSQVWWENVGQVAVIGGVDGFHATSWIFSMKNRFPNNYRDVRVTELQSDGPIVDARSVTINVRELDYDARQSLKMALLAAKEATKDDKDDE